MSSPSDLEAVHASLPPEPAAAAHGALVRSGAELVALAERFYVRVFTGVLGAVGLASLAALTLLPVRSSSDALGLTTPTVLLAGLLVLGAPFAMKRAGTIYGLIRRHPGAEFVPAAVAAALLAYPLRSEFWWPALALLVLLAVVAPMWRALGWCLLVLLTNLAAHLIAGDLDEIKPVTIAGLWVGLPFWTATGSVFAERMAAYLMRINQASVDLTQPPVRVATWTDPHARGEPQAVVSSAPTTEGHAVAASERGGARNREVTLDGLTTRQLEVVALLADGLSYREVGQCLSISVRQVQRHVSDAVNRTGLHNANQLVAVAAADGIVPWGRTPDS